MIAAIVSFAVLMAIVITVIDSSEVMFYGDKLATIRTALRHLLGSKLHDRQDAVYGCRKVDGERGFTSHLSVDVTE